MFITSPTRRATSPCSKSRTAANTSASYNNVNELASLAGQPFVYDANGNLVSDGQRNYAWDAENRLVGITYAAQPGKQTSFALRIAVGTRITERPPHRTVRAAFPHTAPTLGV